MSSVTLNPVTYGGLSFTNIAESETDSGNTFSLIANSGQPIGVSSSTGIGIAWSGVTAGVYYANSSEVVNLSYTVSSGSSSSLIDSIGQLYTADLFSGPGVSLVAVENVYDTSGNLLGTETFVQGQASPGSVTLSQAEQTVNVTVTLTMAVDSTGNSSSFVLISAMSQSFGTITPPPATASIGDIVFFDGNDSGLESGFNSGPGVPGVTVELLNGTGTSVLETTTTNASGAYNFSNLAAGTYEVAFVAPTGYGFSPQGVGSNPGINSSANQTTGITGPITLTAGQVDNNVEAGLVPGGSAGGASATIGTTVWLDSNYDGLDDNSEAGISGVTVELLNGTGTSVIATTTTNASGTYQFTNLSAGTYEVQFVAPTGDSFTTENVTGGAGVMNSVANSAGLTATITLTAGENDTAVNAGLTVPTAALGSTVFLDANRDGLLDNGETGVAGVTVELLNGTGTSVLATTTTNSSGTYAFTGLNAGAYEVEFVSPTGDQFTTQGVGSNPAINSSANTTTGITAPVTLTAGQVDNNVNAGLETPPAALGSTVWFDANRDGLLDNSEAGVAGVTVELLNGTGTSVLATTTTNSSGTYAFTGLNAGAYEIEFIAPTGDQFTTQGVGSNPAIDSSANATTGITAPVTLTAGQVDNNVNAGLETPPAALGSTVWFDANRDGLLDNGETGVAGVTVELLNGTGTSVLATTTTNSSGTYAFTGLNAGAYEVEFIAPTGDQFTTQGVGTNPAVDSSANATTGITAPVTLTAGQVDNNVNAGLETPPAALGSTVWFDANRDGLLDNGETGVAGVTVDLLNGTGTSVLATTTTNSSGTYAFTGLNAGAYEVKFIAPTGDQFTTQGVGTNPAIDSSANATTGITAPVTLTAGQVDNNVNAGLETPPAALGSTVWFDANRDGLLDNGETGVAGVTVDLLNGTGTSVLATTTTNSSGTYAFTGLNAGAYEVKFIAPTGDQFTTQGVGTNPAIDSSANATTGITAPVTLTAGQVDNNVNAGLETPPAALGSTVWFDSNRDGLLDNSEAGVAGVTVELLNGTGTSILATTTTNSSGTYAFTGLNAGAYEVKFIAPTGDQFTTQGVGTNPAIDSSANATTGITAPVTLTAGQVDNNVNAGLETPPAALGSTVWFDANRDGLLDNGEAGVAGVTVELLNGTGTSVLATTTTNSSGIYAFTNLNAGAYEVEFIAPTGDQFTTQGVGTNPAIDSSANATTGITAPVTLTAGQVDNNVNAGLETPPAALGSTVWFDANRDGLLDNGETGVAGVTVDLLNGTGTSVLATTTTNSSGTYAFTGLNAGAYEVKFIAPTGDQFTTQGVGTNPAIDSSANATTGITAPVTLTAGQVDNNVNAGLETPPAALGSTVWFDSNRDGLLDNGETGVAGVTVELLNGTGTSVLATTTTNSSGTYAFTNLNAGAYEVEFIAPAGDQFTTQGVGTNPAVDSSANATTGITAPVTLTAGQVDNNVNAGLETPPAALGDYVWLDANRNGTQDAGEAGVAGVTVELLNGTGTSVLATTTTNSSGIYAFTNLNAGVYEVEFIAPTGDQFTTQGTNPASTTDSNPNQTTGITAPITLTAGQVNNTIDAGLETPPAALGSTVWFDSNRDGLLDNGETGVAGVTVELLNGTGTSVLATTTTNSSGIYAFTNLNAGAYEVEFIAPTGDQFTTQGVGTNPAVDSSANATTGITTAVTLTAGQTDNNVNAGLETPPAALGDYVWLDTNKNGLQDTGETAVAGVTVELLNGTGTSVLATTTTNSSGNYAFTNLNAGTYEVEFIAPAGDAFTTANVGTNAAVNSDANQTTGITTPITLTAGQVNNTIDAGLIVQPAALGSTVWFDTNRDGLLDNGETGVAGVTVDLLNAAGTSILATTTTNSSGIYAFTNLNPGAYEVKFIAPTGDQFTTQGVGTNPAIDSSANATTGITAAVTLTAGQVDNNVNAGLQRHRPHPSATTSGWI